jgi:FkbM family methyltransferase
MPSYLDVGAHHPVFLSNTYLFYEKGCSGVCVEPDPTLFSEIKRKRHRDICLNIGVGSNNKSEADFYIMSSRAMNTFSQAEAERYQSYGSLNIEKKIKIPLIQINQIISDNFSTKPNLISLDVEGLDIEIIKTFDFVRYRPEIFCIETLTYTEDKSESKIPEIISHMETKNYFLYADTYINSIFVDKEIWFRR